MIQLKTPEDIQGIKAASHILMKTHKLISEMLTPGITTAAIDKEAHNFMTKFGSIPTFLHYQGYPASICISVNEEVIHGIPGNRKLQEGDIISVDIGVTHKGYISDCARTFPVGKVSQEAELLMNVTKECLDKAVAQSICGNRVKDISKAVFNHAKAYNYGVVREFCGHGVGFQLHEDPQIPNYISRGSNTRLRHGMVIAIEPMINAGTDDIIILDDEWTVITADRSLSAHFEHTIAIFEDRTEILTYDID